jgi:hypothetical protein
VHVTTPNHLDISQTKTDYETVEEYLKATGDKPKTTQEEIAEWEAEMIAEESGKAESGKLSGWNDYAG